MLHQGLWNTRAEYKSIWEDTKTAYFLFIIDMSIALLLKIFNRVRYRWKFELITMAEMISSCISSIKLTDREIAHNFLRIVVGNLFHKNQFVRHNCSSHLKIKPKPFFFSSNILFQWHYNLSEVRKLWSNHEPSIVSSDDDDWTKHLIKCTKIHLPQVLAFWLERKIVCPKGRTFRWLPARWTDAPTSTRNIENIVMKNYSDIEILKIFVTARPQHSTPQWARFVNKSTVYVIHRICTKPEWARLTCALSNVPAKTKNKLYWTARGILCKVQIKKKNFNYHISHHIWRGTVRLH